MPAILGAIRWDIGYYGTGGTSDEHEANSLRNRDFHGRAPFWATVRAANSLDVAATQATMDQEIAFANQGKVAYWAVLRYANLVAGAADGGLALYQSSASKGALKWASMEQVGTFGNQSNHAARIGRLVAEMGQAHYQRVMANRPLLFLYYEPGGLNNHFGGSLPALKTAIDAIRADAQAAGNGNPYVVLCYTGDGTAEPVRSALGLDAHTRYISTIPAQLDAPYPVLAAAAAADWPVMAALGSGVVPLCMTGWAQQSRMVRPVPWIANRPWTGLRRTVVPATDAEMAAHIKAAADYVAANPASCASEAILAYSWNEFSEGARPLCPTRANPTGTHLPGIAAALP